MLEATCASSRLAGSPEAEPGVEAGGRGQRAGPAWPGEAHCPQPAALGPGVCFSAFLSRGGPQGPVPMAVPPRSKCLHSSGPRALPAQATVSWEVTGNPCQMPEVGVERMRERSRSRAEPPGAAGLSPQRQRSLLGAHTQAHVAAAGWGCPAQDRDWPLLSAPPRIPAPRFWLAAPSRCLLPPGACF